MVRRSALRQLVHELSRWFSPFVLSVGVVLPASVVLPLFVVAQVTTITPDSSLPSHTVVSQIGDVYHINVGTIIGRNQFHSFSQFDLSTGEIASFNGPATIVNILNRVTGGMPSSIDGTLRSSIEGASLFFLNPAGVVFGAEAKLDLTGSFHSSTADFLRFEDDAKFYADVLLDHNLDSILMTAPLEDFGFLNNPIAFGFTNTSPESLVFEGTNFQVLEGNTISVVGGDIILKAHGMGNDFRSARLSAEGGLIHVVSLKSSGEVPVGSQEIQANTTEHFGEIILSDEAALTTNGVHGGAVVIRGGRLVMDNAEISVNTSDGHGNPIGVDIHTKNDIVLTHNSRITSNTHGTGQAGNIHLHTSILSIGVDSGGAEATHSKSKIESSTSSSGNAGNITLNVGTLEAVDAEIFSLSTLNSPRSGNAGQITIEGLSSQGESHPAQLVMLKDSQVDTIVNTGEGQGGDILAVAKNVELHSTGVRADAHGTGSAGSITFNVESLTGLRSFLGSRNRNPNAGGGNAGNITIQGVTGKGSAAKTIAFPQNSRLTTSIIPPTNFGGEYKGDGKGGQIKLIASDSITLRESNLVTNVHNRQNAQDSAVSMVEVTAPNVSIGYGGIRATTTGSRNAGNIIVTATERLTLSDSIGPGVPRIEAESSRTGHAGSIVFNVGELHAVDAQILSSSTGTGRAGNVTIQGLNSPVPGPIDLMGTTIRTEATSGRGGGINIDAGNIVTLDSSFVSARVTDGGHGGDVTIRSGMNGHGQLLLRNNSLVMAESSGVGDAGTIRLDTSEILRISDSIVNTEATLSSGGNIKLTADHMIHLLNSTLESSVAGDATTKGGNIDIDPEFVLIKNSHLLARANKGAGGNIELSSNVLLMDDVSVIDASSAFGVSGNVNISSPIQNLSGTIVPLPDELIKVTLLYGDRCFSHKDGNYNSFTRRSRQVSREPGGFLMSPFLEHASTMMRSNDDFRSRPLPVVKRLGISRQALGLKASYRKHARLLRSQHCMF